MGGERHGVAKSQTQTKRLRGQGRGEEAMQGFREQDGVAKPGALGPCSPLWGPHQGHSCRWKKVWAGSGGMSGEPGGRSRPAGMGTPAHGRRGTPSMPPLGGARRHGRGPRSPCLVPSENRGAWEEPSSGHLGSGRGFPLRARARPSSCRMGGSSQGSPGTHLVHQTPTQTQGLFIGCTSSWEGLPRGTLGCGFHTRWLSGNAASPTTESTPRVFSTTSPRRLPTSGRPLAGAQTTGLPPPHCLTPLLQDAERHADGYK